MKHRVLHAFGVACIAGGLSSPVTALEMTPSLLSSLLGKSRAEVDALIGAPSQKSGYPIACRDGRAELEEISCQYGTVDIAVTYRSGIARSLQWQPRDLNRKLNASDFPSLSGCKVWSKREWDETFDCGKAVRLRIDYTTEGTGQVDIFGSR